MRSGKDVFLEDRKSMQKLNDRYQVGREKGKEYPRLMKCTKEG